MDGCFVIIYIIYASDRFPIQAYAGLNEDALPGELYVYSETAL